MSWYTSRRQYFNRITNDSSNKLRFITKTNNNGTTTQQQQHLSSNEPKATNKTKAQVKAKPTDKNKHRLASAQQKGSGPKTVTDKQASSSKRKINFTEKTRGPNKKGKTDTNVKEKASNQGQKVKTSKVTQDNFI